MPQGMDQKMTIYDVDATELIEEVAKELKNIEAMQPPTWADFVKTGTHKERPPTRSDWWFVRAASVIRKVRLKGPIGVGKLRTLYGGLKNMGHQPERFKKGSGSIIRRILQQLEIAELIKQDKKGAHKGRVITPKGIKLMDNAAKKINTNKPVEKPKEAPKSEESKKAKPKQNVPEGSEKKSEATQAKKPEEKKEDPKSKESPKAEQKTAEKKE